jgi:hypothetical protein
MLHKFKLYLTVFILSTAFLSCSDSITNRPATDENSTELLNHKLIENGNTQYSVTRTINGSVGGTIQLNAIHNGFLRIMTVSATLIIPPGAFSGTQDITMTADFSNASFYFSPSMVFDIPLYLDAFYTGLDLNELNLFNNDIIFAYIDDLGNVYPVENKRITVNLLQGLLGVNKAVIEHFSRYGFTR